MAMLRAYKALRPAPGFLVVEPPKSHSFTAELFASVREDGRIVDVSRVVLGGSDILEVSFKLGLIYNDPLMAEWTVVVQRWPRDLEIRRGMLSSLWSNIYDWVSSRDAHVLDENGEEVSAASFLKRARDADDGPEAGAARWAIVLSDAALLSLQLQCLPASAAILNGKPTMKR